MRDARPTQRSMYAPHTQRDVDEMLQAIGVERLDELLRVPETIALKAKLDVVPALPEYLIQRRFDQFAKENAGIDYRSFLRRGRVSPLRSTGHRGVGDARGVSTAYTPYQAEV